MIRYKLYGVHRVLIFVLVLIVSIALVYGSASEYIFKNIAFVKKYSLIGHIPDFEPLLNNLPVPFPGYYAIGITIVEVCKISPDVLPFIPISVVPFTLSLYIFLRRITNDWCLTTAIIAIFVTYGWVNPITFYPHELGGVLFLLVVYATTKYLNMPESRWLFIVFLILSGIYYISYKAMFWTIIYLILLLLYIYTHSNHKKNLKLIWSTLIYTLVIVLSNNFLYNTFLQLYIFNEAAITNSGLDLILAKLRSLFNRSEDEFSKLVFTTPSIIAKISMAKLVIITSAIGLYLYIFVFKNLSKRNIDTSNFMIFSIIIIGVINLLIYNLIGYFDITLLIYAGILSFSTLFIRYKKIIFAFILILLVMNISQFVLVDPHDFEYKDENHFKYLIASAKWYKIHGTTAKADALTQGYYLMATIDSNTKINTILRMRLDDVLFLIGIKSRKEYSDWCMYIVNHRESKLTLDDWKVIKNCFNIYIDLINNNNKIDKIYSDQFISMHLCTTTS